MLLGNSNDADVTLEQAYQAARLASLSILGTLKRELSDLDRVTAWLMVSGFVNVAAGFTKTTVVINGCSDLILELYGPEVGQYARTAMGVATTPFGIPVILQQRSRYITTQIPIDVFRSSAEDLKNIGPIIRKKGTIGE